MKKIMYLFAVMALTATFVACEKMDMDKPIGNTDNSNIGKESVIENFAKALAVVLHENEECRDLIKTEALKKINHDYDVLYMLVKDKELNNGATLTSLMLDHISSEDLEFMIKSFPTLTIFVPSLPENSFSCDSWDIQTQIPDVAIRSINNSKTYCFDALGNDYFLENDEIPGFPIVVLKINERIKVSSNSNSLALRSSDKSDSQFDFIDDIFNNIYSKGGTRRGEINDNLKKVQESYNIFPNNTKGWQRDYVYYGLTNEQNKGPFDLRYKEHIIGFQLRKDVDGVLNRISDQEEDQKLIDRYGWFELRRKYPNQSRSPLTPWTEGEFEFEVIFKVVSKNLADNAHSIKFRCAPEQLFVTKTRNKTKGALWWKKTVYQITDIQFLYCPLQVPLFEWNLENYGTSFELSISEFDQSETITTESSTTSEFASNFSFDQDIGIGEKVKIGLKFGQSAKEIHTSKITVVRTLKSDELGPVIINFGDELIMSNDIHQVQVGYSSGSVYQMTIPDFNKKYYTDYYQIFVAPIYTGK